MNTEPASTIDPTRVGTARVAYWFTVAGQEIRKFSAETETSGPDTNAATAAMKLTAASLEDAKKWVNAQPAPLQEQTIMVRGLFWRHPRKILVERIEPSDVPTEGVVNASVEINGETHYYSNTFTTTGNPYRACAAALNAARGDLWNWAYTQECRQ